MLLQVLVNVMLVWKCMKLSECKDFGSCRMFFKRQRRIIPFHQKTAITLKFLRREMWCFDNQREYSRNSVACLYKAVIYRKNMLLGWKTIILMYIDHHSWKTEFQTSKLCRMFHFLLWCFILCFSLFHFPFVKYTDNKKMYTSIFEKLVITVHRNDLM